MTLLGLRIKYAVISLLLYFLVSFQTFTKIFQNDYKIGILAVLILLVLICRKFLLMNQLGIS